MKDENETKIFFMFEIYLPRARDLAEQHKKLPGKCEIISIPSAKKEKKNKERREGRGE